MRAGVCGNARRQHADRLEHQVGRAAAGAAGGSELSDAGRWTTGEPLVHDLKTTTARAMYNHNNTRGVWFYMYAGAKGTLYSGILPGQDDEVVAYHSSGGGVRHAGGSYCNPQRLVLQRPDAGHRGQRGRQAEVEPTTTSWFRDDAEYYNHYRERQLAGHHRRRCAPTWRASAK